MAVTIEWLLNQKTFTGLTCLTGNDAIDNEITGIDMLDNPDTSTLYEKGQFVLSTGYIIKEHPHLADTIIRDLYSCGCSGLGIKMDRYFSKLPISMLKQAEELHFPIISFPPFHPTMEEFSNLVYHQICNQELTSATIISEAYRDITENALKTHDLRLFLTEITNFIQHSTFLCNENFSILDYCLLSTDMDLYSHFCQKKFPLLSEQDKDYLNATYEKEHFIFMEHSFIYKKTKFNFYFYPITDNKTLLGYLLIPAVPTLSECEQNFLETILSIAAMQMIWFMLRMQKNTSEKREFVQDVLIKPFTNATKIETQCNLYNFDFKTPRVCMILIPDDTEFNSLSAYKKKLYEQNLWDLLLQYLNGKYSYFHLSYNHKFVLFLFDEKFESTQYFNHCLSNLSKAYQKLLTENSICCLIGYSQCYSGANTIKTCFDNALQTIKIGSKLHPGESIFSYREDAVFHELYQNFSSENLYQVYAATIKPLIDYEKQYHSDLVITLEAFFENQLNITQTAKTLYLHRNTIIYRVKKIEELLGVNLKKWDDCVRIQWGFYVLKIMDIL